MKVATAANWLRGVNAVTGKATLIQGSVRRISNFVYTKRGSLLTVDGTQWVSDGSFAQNDWVSAGASAPAIPVALFAANAAPAPLFPLAVTLLTSTGSWEAFDFSPVGTARAPAPIFAQPNAAPNNAWGGRVPFAPGVVPIDSLRLPQLVNVNGLVVLCPGNDGIPVWGNFFNQTQGVVGSNPAGAPVAGAAHGCLHQSFLWLWNTGSGNAAIDSPSTLRMCSIDAAGNPDVTLFPALNFAKVDPTDGTQGQGMVSFTSAEAGIAPTATLVLFKDYSTYQVTGLLQPGGGYAITRAQTDMGCVSPRSIVFAPGFGIIRLTHFGIAVFDGGSDKLISEEIRPYLFQEESDIQAIDWTRVNLACATTSINPPMYCLALPLPGIGGNSRIICYDLVMKQWTVVDLPPPPPNPPNKILGPILPIATLKIPGRRATTYMADFAPTTQAWVGQSGAGQIRKWLDGDPDWDGVAIKWMIKTPPLFSENPTTPLYVRRTALRARTSNVPITGTFESDNTQFQGQTTISTYQYLNSPSLYGFGRYGTATYGNAYPDLVVPFDLGYKCWSTSVRYNGTGIIELLATDWHYEMKPAGVFSRVS